MSDDSGGETRIGRDAIGGDKKVAGHEIHAQTVNVYSGASAPPAPARGWYRPPTTLHYVARGIEQAVRDALQREGSAAIVSVYAPGGAGKTEMASRICGELEGQFEHVWWIDCGDKNPSQTLAQLALVLGLHFVS